jgi:hypothetical protein
MAGGESNFRLIDDDHGYDAVKHDFEGYSQFVRSGGLMGFHDTQTEIRTARRFFAELPEPKEEI